MDQRAVEAHRLLRRDDLFGRQEGLHVLGNRRLHHTHDGRDVGLRRNAVTEYKSLAHSSQVS